MPTRPIWLIVFAWLAGTIVVIGLLGVIGVTTFVDQHALTTGNISALNPAVVWHKWDALWYERIAVHGYGYELDNLKGQAAAAFFPLYPLTVGALLQLLPGASFFWVASLLSGASSFAALGLMAAHLAATPEHARRTILVALTSAGSFYLMIPYAEGLFLLLVVLTMLLTRQRWYVIAGLCCGLAAVTRVQGFALIAVPVFACLVDPDLAIRQRIGRAAGGMTLFALPVLGYLAYMAHVQGDALAFIARQALWSNATPYPFRAVVGLIAHPRWIQGWPHGAFWALYVGLLARYWRRMPLGEALFCAGALLIATQQLTFQGIYRYVTPLVPLTLAIAADKHTVRLPVVAFNLVFATLMILAFVTWNRLAV
ncbi:MAG: hypothetical protein ABI051_17410 [Vicinamibacterales bacterium]